MQPPPASQIHEFGDFELDIRRRILRSRGDGQPVEITGRVLDALIYLVERPGQLVEKKALIEALWPHVIVEEGNLTQTIHTLRKVLGEAPGDHRYIATIAGRGYRWVANVRAKAETAAAEAPPPPPASPPPSRRKRIVLASISLALVAIALIALFVSRDQQPNAVDASSPRSIAVLPFVDMSAEQDQAHFADGLSEEILNTLARSGGLRVIARTSSFSFRDRDVDIKTIAQRLSVTHVLEGSVRKSGDRLRITAQLIDASTSAHVWSDTFDRDIHDIFGVQREIASAVGDALHVTLDPVAPTRAETNSTDAYEHYLQGRMLFNRRAGNDLLQAKANLEEAVEIDPKYARAWAALAGVYLVARYEGPVLPDAQENWRKAAERAVALAPDLAEANYRVAQYYLHSGQEKAGREHMDRAVALDPRDPLVIGRSLTYAISEGRFEDAIELQKAVVATDPLSATQRGNLGFLLMLTGRLTEALEELERALELSPASVSTRGSIADVLILQGRIDEALVTIGHMNAGVEQDQRFALAYFARGDVTRGEAMLARLIAQAEKAEPSPELLVAIASAHTARNDKDAAFEWLDKARVRLERNPGSLHRLILGEELHGAIFLKPLHSDPRWKKLMAETGIEYR